MTRGNRTTTRAAAPEPIGRAPVAAAVLVFVATFALRVQGASVDFILLRDQMRDWTIALGPLRDLPLVGPATHVGGYTIGPAFYWILWAIRVVVGPAFDNLPHAGGIGQAALQSGADAILLVGVWRRTQSPWVALATVVLVATASFDLSLAAIVWNPTMGTALAKVAIGLVLLDWHRRSPLHAAALVAVAWSAVHAYTGAIFVAVGVFAALLVDPLIRGERGPLTDRDRRMAMRNAIVIAVVVIALQLPYVVYQVQRGFRDQAMGAVTGSVANVVTGERPPEISKSISGYIGAVRFIQIDPVKVPGAGWLLLICAGVVGWRYRRDPDVLSVVLLPQALAIAGFSLFLAGLDHYYYLSLMPCAVLTVTLVASALPAGRASLAAGGVALAAALLLIPGRLRHERTMPRMPEYRILLDASRKIRGQRQPMRAIRTDFALPPTGDPEYLFQLMGGTIDRTAPWMATISADGRIDYRRIEGS